MLPLITTIIPTYRRPQLVPRAILSVLGQTYPHLRILVLDNASGDETGEVVRKMAQHDPRITYHCHNINIGSYANFNWGMHHVETPFFSLLSDDDLVMPNFFEKALACFNRYPDAMLASFSTLVIDEDYLIRMRSVVPSGITYYPAHAAFEAALRNDRIELTWTGILYRKQVYAELGGVNEHAGPLADKGYNLHAAARFPIVACSDIMGILMSHRNTTSSNTESIGLHRSEWRDRWVQDIVNDERVSQDIKQMAQRKTPIDNSLRTAFLQIFRSLKEGDWGYARNVITGVRALGHAITANMLELLLCIYRYSRPIREVILWCLSVCRWLYRYRLGRQTNGLTEYVDYVKKLDQQVTSLMVNAGDP